MRTVESEEERMNRTPVLMFSQLSLFTESGVAVRRISYEDTVPFILGIHYARRMPCVQYAYGLFLDGTLIGCVTYGQPASPSLCKGVAGTENAHRVLELNRLVILPEYNGKNYASVLVSKSLSYLPRRTFVVSYADSAWGHVGYIYQATNWMYTGMTKDRTDIYSDGGHSRHYKKGETKRQYRSAKHRYIYLVGTKADRKAMMKELRYPVLTVYPKGASVHYDTENPKPLQEGVSHGTNTDVNQATVGISHI